MPNNAVVDVDVAVDGCFCCSCLDIVVVVVVVVISGDRRRLVGDVAALLGEYDQDFTLFSLFPKSDNKKNVVTNKEKTDDAEERRQRQDSE